MNTQPLGAPSRVTIRWPFRILAAIIVLAVVVGTVGTAFMWWSRGAGASKWQTLCTLPAAFWLFRLAWEAAVHGRTPASLTSWPFASENVGIAYLIILFAAS